MFNEHTHNGIYGCKYFKLAELLVDVFYLFIYVLYASLYLALVIYLLWIISLITDWYLFIALFVVPFKNNQ